MSPIEWRISGDRDLAIRKLKGLGLNWLYKVKNWRHLGNLNWFDSGWKKYMDGDVRVVSFGDYDKIYINALPKAERKGMEYKMIKIHTQHHWTNINPDEFIIKYNSKGDTIWENHDGTPINYNWVGNGMPGIVPFDIYGKVLYTSNELRKTTTGDVTDTISDVFTDIDFLQTLAVTKDSIFYAGGQGSYNHRKRTALRFDKSTKTKVWKFQEVDEFDESPVTKSAVDSSGYYVGGFFYDGDGNTRYKVIKLDYEDGHLLWTHVSTETYNPAWNTYWGDVYAMRVKPDGLYISVTELHGTTAYPVIPDNMMVRKLDLETGATIWESAKQTGRFYDIDVSGNTVICGGNGGLAGIPNYNPGLLVALDSSDGTELWRIYTTDDSGGVCSVWEGSWKGLEIDSGFFYVGGSEFNKGSAPSTCAQYRWALEKRSVKTGNLIWDQRGDWGPAMNPFLSWRGIVALKLEIDEYKEEAK